MCFCKTWRQLCLESQWTRLFQDCVSCLPVYQDRPCFPHKREALLLYPERRDCDGVDIRPTSWGMMGAGQRHGKGLRKSAQPDLSCRTTHRWHSRETVLPGAGRKTNRAQAVVRGSQGQLDVSARAPGNKAQVLTQSKGGAPDPDMAGVGASPGEARLEASGVGGLGAEQGCQAAYVRNSGVGNEVGIPGQDRNPLGRAGT